MHKLKRENLEAKSKEDRKDRASFMDKEDKEEYLGLFSGDEEEEETTEDPGTGA